MPIQRQVLQKYRQYRRLAGHLPEVAVVNLFVHSLLHRECQQSGATIKKIYIGRFSLCPGRLHRTQTGANPHSIF
jgi:hypothetical protein